VTTVQRTAKGLETESRQTFPGVGIGAAGPVGVALLLPAVQGAREAARRQQAANQIKQQLLALHNFHDTHGALPPAYTKGQGGKPLLSWRVAILPFLEQKRLYDQFHHDEAWDSEHNKRLIEHMPSVFRSPNSKAKPGMTNFLGIGGPHGVLSTPGGENAKTGVRFQEVTDGTSNTIAIVEASDDLATVWTKPEQFIPDGTDPLKGLLGMRPNGFQAGFADGSVRFIAKNIDPNVLKFLFSRDDGNAVNIDGPQAAPRRPGPGPAPKAPPKAPPRPAKKAA
jgi:hypothetical protein